MSNVTIKGRISTAILNAGETATVEYTDRIQNLVDRGYVVVLDSEQGAASLTGVVTADDDIDDLAAGPAPARNASTAEWREFMEANGIEMGEDATRDQMIATWEQGPADG